MPESAVLLTAIAWFGGGIVGVVTGFGCGLFAVPIMLLAIPPEIIMPVSIVLCAIVMTMLLVPYWGSIYWRDFWECSLVAIPGAFFGVWLLSIMPVATLEIAFGIFLVCSVIVEILRQFVQRGKRAIQNEPIKLFLALLAGVIDGVCGMGGPALGLYASLAHWDKDMARGTFGLFFGVNLFLCTGLLWFKGMLGPRELELCTWGAPGGIAGIFAGIPLAKHLPQETFRRLLLAVIFISGCVLIYRGF